MTKKPPSRDGAEVFKFPDRKGLTREEIVQQNEQVYWENIRELERQYGGKLVTEKAFSILLLGMVQRYARTHKDDEGNPAYPDVLRPKELPAEEFVPVCLTFTIAKLGIVEPRWYFIRRPRRFPTA